MGRDLDDYRDWANTFMNYKTMTNLEDVKLKLDKLIAFEEERRLDQLRKEAEERKRVFYEFVLETSKNNFIEIAVNNKVDILVIFDMEIFRDVLALDFLPSYHSGIGNLISYPKEYYEEKIYDIIAMQGPESHITESNKKKIIDGYCKIIQNWRNDYDSFFWLLFKDVHSNFFLQDNLFEKIVKKFMRFDYMYFLNNKIYPFLEKKYYQQSANYCVKIFEYTNFSTIILESLRVTIEKISNMLVCKDPDDILPVKVINLGEGFPDLEGNESLHNKEVYLASFFSKFKKLTENYKKWEVGEKIINIKNETYLNPENFVLVVGFKNYEDFIKFFYNFNLINDTIREMYRKIDKNKIIKWLKKGLTDNSFYNSLKHIYIKENDKSNIVLKDFKPKNIVNPDRINDFSWGVIGIVVLAIIFKAMSIAIISGSIVGIGVIINNVRWKKYKKIITSAEDFVEKIMYKLAKEIGISYKLPPRTQFKKNNQNLVNR